MTWTKEKPKIAGWYWYRARNYSRTIIYVDSRGNLCITDLGTIATFHDVQRFDPQFAGPLEVPR